MCVRQILSTLNFFLVIISYFLQLWERRSRFVQESEQWMWKDVTAPMMSDQEPIEDRKIARKCPSWRSEGFNNLIDTLDERANSCFKNSARKKRILVPGIEMTVPTDLSEWMMA